MDEIFKINKDLRRAADLLKMAKERIKDVLPILPKNITYKIIEENYEIVVQLITGIMYADGYKTLNHISLIDYLKENYKEFNSLEIEIIDTLRKLRHGIVYYGKKVESIFLTNNLSHISHIAKKLISILEKRLDKGVK